MPTVYFQSSENSLKDTILLNENESLLDGLLRSGIDIPYGCKAGLCQSCLMQSKANNIPSKAQVGLNSAQVEQGFFMSCCCVPEDEFQAHLTSLESELKPAKVVRKTALNNVIFSLRIEKVISYHPGQFATLWNSNNVARSYSIASHPDKDSFIEFHIKRIENGAFSQWAWDNLEVDDTLQIRGPLGECFYTQSDFTQPIVLCGIGTGLAPLYGILRDALSSGHTGKIHLFVASKNSHNLYYIEELLAMEKNYSNFSFSCIVQEMEPNNQYQQLTQGNIYEEVKKFRPDFSGTKVFLCGADSFVRKMKKQCFLAGAAMSDISSDAFIAFKNH